MRIDTVKTKVYKFDELSDKAKATAIEQFSDINTEHYDWWESVYDMWKEKLEAMGYYEVDIKFSGFYSQGDGASFTAKVDLGKWLKYHKRAMYYRILLRLITEYSQLTAKIERNTSHYVHERSISAVIHDDIYESSDKIEAKYTELEKELDKNAEELSAEIYSDLKKEYEGMTSEEAIAETILANDYEFTEDGKQY